MTNDCPAPFNVTKDSQKLINLEVLAKLIWANQKLETRKIQRITEFSVLVINSTEPDFFTNNSPRIH